MSHITVVQRILGLLLAIFSVSMLPPLAVSLYYGDSGHTPFAFGFIFTLITGCVIYWPVRHAKQDLKLRDGFLIVVMFWTVLGLFGAIPLLLSERPVLTFTDAVFESISGLTTTGATVIVGLDDLPRAILYSSGWVAWVSSCWPSLFCRCSALGVCSCIGRKPLGR